MPTPIYPSWNDKEYDLLKKMTENTALIADYEIGDVASVAGTAGNVLVNGGTAAATGAITLSLPSAIRVADGTLSAPVFSFSADSDTGLFRAASGSVAYASNGIRTFAFPTVTGSSGQFLTTDGAGNITWGTGSGTLPSQTGNAGKLLTTDGVNASWSSTLAGNLTVSGTGGIQLNSVANLTWGGAYGAGIPTIAIPSATSIGFYPTGSTSGKTFELFGTGNATLTGNLTVSGTGQQTFSGRISSSHSTAGSSSSAFVNTASNGYGLLAQGGSTLASTQYVFRAANYLNADAFVVYSDSATLAGNLIVSGGTITGGTSGLSLASGGTNQNITLTPSGTGTNVLNKGLSVLNTIGQFSGTSAPASGAGVEVGMLSTTGGLIFAYNRTTSASLPLSLQHAGGNLLIGTTADTGEKLQVNGTGYFAGALLQLGNGSNDALYRVSASNGKSSDFGDDTTGGFVRANNSQSLRFITAGNIVLTLDSSANATFAGDIRFSSTNTFDIGQTGTRVRNAFIRTLVLTSNAPAAANSTGTAGTLTWDADYIYVCTATDTWKRVAIATWP